MNCLFCYKETDNPKFCSRSCAAKRNNTLAPKRRPEGSCKVCKTTIISQRTYCDLCWQKSKTRIENGLYCSICNKNLIGKQTKFCSTYCKNRDSNFRLQNYKKQQEKGLERKISLVIMSGGCCQKCGYNKNLSSLVFHHIVPSSKDFQLDLRHLSNHSCKNIINEYHKCQLLCHNCHSETHHPHMSNWVQKDLNLQPTDSRLC